MVALNLTKCPNKHFDLAIVDPPYGKDIANREYYGSTKNDGRWQNRENTKKYEPKNWDKCKPGKAEWSMAMRWRRHKHIVDFLDAATQAGIARLGEHIGWPLLSGF